MKKTKTSKEREQAKRAARKKKEAKMAGRRSKKTGGIGECFKLMFSCFLTYATPHNSAFDDDCPEDLNVQPLRAQTLPRQKCSGRVDDQAKEKNNGAMLSFHNSTLHCVECNGRSYWASFNEKSFLRGRRFKLYQGILNGVGPHVGDRCVVKVFANTYGSEKLCEGEVRKSDKLRQLVRDFNQKLGDKSPYRLRSTLSYWAPIDEISMLKSLFFTGHKSLSIGEGVIIEQDLRVSEYSTKKCKAVTSFVDESGVWFYGSYSQLINAFIHFTYDYSGGSLVMCGLDGVKDDKGFFLSTPTIHSEGRDYGLTDNGVKGIADVMRNHTCGPMCEMVADKHINRPSSLHIDIEVRRNLAEKSPSPPTVPGDSRDWGKELPTSPQSVFSTCSHTSVFTENIPFSEPSAPEMEEMDDVMIQPPPYTPAQETRVAYWIIGEESPNAFLHSSPNMFLPYPSVSLGTSIECQSAYTAQNTLESVDMESCAPSTTTTQERNAPSRTLNQDVNANFMCHNTNEPCNENAPANNASMSPAREMAGTDTSVDQTVVGPTPERKKCVRFEDQTSNCQKSPTAPSVFTGVSDDVTMDTCTSASILSSPTLATRSRNHQRHNSICTDSTNVQSVAGNDMCSPTDLPPPYSVRDPSQTEIATAYWLLRRNGYDMHSFRPPVDSSRIMCDNMMTSRNHTINNDSHNNTDNNNNNNNNNDSGDDYLQWIRKY